MFPKLAKIGEVVITCGTKDGGYLHDDHNRLAHNISRVRSLWWDKYAILRRNLYKWKAEGHEDPKLR
jgi:hypothetical protein